MKDLRHFTTETIDTPQPITRNIAKSFMANVFSYMFLGLTLTGVTAWYFANSGLIFEYLINPETGGASPLMWVVMFAPLGLVFLMSLGYNKLSTMAMLLVFVAFAILNGISFSTIFLSYDLGSIYKAFGSASVVFALMAIVGYTTETDLTKLGNILRIGLIALIIAMVINFFMQSGAMDYVISIIGVVIFTGLTAYDVQKLKRIGAGEETVPGSGIKEIPSKKRAIYGALDLYLDFINLFLFLLRLFGSRD
jgi:FtsH-binding integral membrane protein